jgi:hypothetical protein
MFVGIPLVYLQVSNELRNTMPIPQQEIQCGDTNELGGLPNFIS